MTRGRNWFGRWVPVVVPATAAGVLLAAGHAWRAFALASVGVAAAGAILAGVDVARLVARGTAKAVDALVVGASWAIFVLGVLPIWAVGRVARPRTSGVWAASESWGEPADVDPGQAPRSFAAANDTKAGGPSRLLRLAGLFMAVLVADFGAGWTWDWYQRRAAPSRVTEDDAGGGVQSRLPRDPRNDEPAMAAYPWREEYFDTIQRPTGGYWPFTEWRPNDYRSRLLNIDGWVRRSYRAHDDRPEMPSVWFFGGSTTWGEGQRDEYTIASWVARLAERDGVPIVVRNYGQRGWTHFQEMVLFEQQLAAEPDPDMAVFYDGANEITSQSLLNEAVPTHVWAYAYAQRLAGSSIATRFVQSSPEAGDTPSLQAAYLEHSLIRKVLRRLAPVAGAGVGQDDTNDVDPGSAFTNGQSQAENGATFDYRATPQDGVDAGRIYERGKQLTLALAERSGIEPFLFWQPVRFVGPPEQRAIAELTEPTVDITTTLAGHDDVFIDGAHTNEEGARLVAERIWQDLAPSVKRWYKER